MSNRWQSSERRLLELLADQAMFGLSADGQQELDSLLAVMPDFDRDCMQRTAATVHLASLAEAPEPLPTSLLERIRADARVLRKPRLGECGANRPPGESDAVY